MWYYKDNEERLLEQDSPVRSQDTASLSDKDLKMFDKDGNYITQDDEAIEFEELDFEEALGIATKRMSVMGYFPWEIKEAAQGMLLRRKN